MRRLSSWLGRLTLVVLPVLAVVGCAEADTVSRAPHSLIRVSERDFRIVVTPGHIPAGEAELVVTNHGLDGLTVEEEALHAVATVEGVDPKHVRRVRLHLAPGRYELFCNMAGHFMAGMHGDLVVG